MNIKLLTALLLGLNVLPTFGRTQRLPCDLRINQQWVDLDPQHTKRFGQKMVLVGELIFRKRSNELISVGEIGLMWKGKKIGHLNASLFKKGAHKTLVPVEESLVCDGTWNNKKQTLIMKFNEKEYLEPTTTFCLVLTIPDTLETTLKDGHFDIITETLPYQIQKTLKKKHTRISFAQANVKAQRLNKLTRNS